MILKQQGGHDSFSQAEGGSWFFHVSVHTKIVALMPLKSVISLSPSHDVFQIESLYRGWTSYFRGQRGGHFILKVSEGVHIFWCYLGKIPLSPRRQFLTKT